jgi:hypothetical protein
VDAFTIKQNDTSPSLSAVLSVDGVPLVIPAGASVTFFMRARCPAGSTSGAVAAAGVVVNGATGSVRYDWAVGNTAVAGQFNGEFKVSVAGMVTTYPSSGYIPVNVTPDLS